MGGGGRIIYVLSSCLRLVYKHSDSKWIHIHYSRSFVCVCWGWGGGGGGGGGAPYTPSAPATDVPCVNSAPSLNVIVVSSALRERDSYPEPMLFIEIRWLKHF